MFRAVLTIILFFCFTSLQAQYYYQEIISLANTGKNYKKLLSNNIKSVAVSSIEPDGSETEDFGISQQVNKNRNELVTFSRSGVTGSSTITTYFNKDGWPVRIIDSTNSTVNEVNYAYDTRGNVMQISSRSHEPSDTNNYTITEDHYYSYHANGTLDKMMKIRDKHDTTMVIFKLTEKGLPGEEQWWKKGRKLENWYYYYDAAGRITDIVRYNSIANKMLPDYIFEYDEDGDISQQTVVLPGTNFYRVWVYEYLENGLKKAESILNKGKVQEGRIIYEYE